MKKFISKTNLFLLPFIALFALNTFLYNPLEGDLVRLGYLYSNPSPKSLITNQYELPKHYTLLSEINLTTKRKFKVITIGDSFSEQDSLGYKSFIGDKGVSVLHIDQFISGSNPIQTHIQLLNSSFFDNISADYIVLQSVERHFNNRNININFDMTISIESISNTINTHNTKIKNHDIPFFSKTTLKIPLINIEYFFEPKPKYSKTYKYKLDCNNLFSNEPNELLFYQEDINKMSSKNDSLSIFQSIKVIENINDLVAMRNMKLVMLISPDKYDLYYPFIKNNNSLKKPRFYEIYGRAEKRYINVDSDKILTEKIKSEKDIYFYDDTHWSPKGAKIIADEIYDIISK